MTARGRGGSGGFGTGDTRIFDWGGVLSALIGAVIVLLIATLVLRLTSSRPSGRIRSTVFRARAREQAPAASWRAQSWARLPVSRSRRRYVR